MIKEIIVSVLGVLAFLGTNLLSFRLGEDYGIDRYHNQCYTSGGFIIDEVTGTVVQCRPLVVLPKEERPMFKGA